MGIELKKIWMDGKIISWEKAQVHVLTHALHYGTAIFEGIRCYATENGPAIFRLSDHMGRLYRGAKAYGFDVGIKPQKMKKAVFDIIKANRVESCYIRPIVYVGYGRIGLNVKGIPVRAAIIPVKFEYFDKKTFQRGLHCGISSWQRISVNTLSPHVKASANYLNSVLAKAEALREGYDEAIMLSSEGHVSEGSAENIFIARKGKLITPPFYDDVLGGVTRESIIEIARDAGITVEEKSILRDELYTADEVFLCGTAAEIIHVRKIDGIGIKDGKAGALTRFLQKTFSDIVNGKDKRYEKWLEYVK